MTQSHVSPITTGVTSVWLIDDNEEFCTVVSATLSESDTIQCTQCFSSCEAAFEALEKREHPPEVILLDIGLPGISGIDGIGKLLVLSPLSKIIMLTGLDREENIIRSLAEGASGYLSKTSTAQELIQAIKATMRGGAPMDPFTIQKLLKFFSLHGNAKANYDLTRKEKQILEHVLDGFSIEGIARSLNVSVHTVSTHLKHLYQKLDVHTRSALATKALKERLV